MTMASAGGKGGNGGNLGGSREGEKMVMLVGTLISRLQTPWRIFRLQLPTSRGSKNGCVTAGAVGSNIRT